MGLQSSLFSGVAGIDSNGSAISVISDNIANSNTVGFKSSRAEFVDVLSGNLGSGGGGTIGSGSRLSGINQNFTQGSLENTGVTTDVAVDGGGFFIVQDTQGVFYTRSGIFRLDSSQNLVNAQDQNVQGFGITPGGLPNGALGNINLSTVSSSPSATTEVDVNVNLDPNDSSSGTALQFNHTDPVTSSNFQTGIRVFDSLGNPRNVLIYFKKNSAASNSWFYLAGVNRSELDFANMGGNFATFASTPATQFFPVQSGTLTFTTDGALLTEGTTALTVPYDSDGDGTTNQNEATPGNAGGWDWLGGATLSQSLVFDFGTPPAGTDQTTQFGGSGSAGGNNFVRFLNQDGFSAGSLSSIDIDENGFVTGSFSNGQTQRLAQLALATFANINGLARVGKNNWLESNDSGNPIVGSPNQSSFGALRAGFLEQSNTDLAEEFVRLILAQRNFQANTRTISTTNELLANLVVLGQ